MREHFHFDIYDIDTLLICWFSGGNRGSNSQLIYSVLMLNRAGEELNGQSYIQTRWNQKKINLAAVRFTLPMVKQFRLFMSILNREISQTLL